MPGPEHKTSLTETPRGRLLLGRRRFQLAWVFAALLIWSAKHYPSFWGGLLCFAGASLRYWASGYVRKDSEIAVGGPYAHTRNPLYLGTLIMLVGASISVQFYGLAVVAALVFFINYQYVIQDEEMYLKDVFGEKFERYCSLVPRFLPNPVGPSIEEFLKVNPNREAFGFSKSLARANKGYEAYLTFFGLIAGVAFSVWLKSC